MKIRQVYPRQRLSDRLGRGLGGGCTGYNGSSSGRAGSAVDVGDHCLSMLVNDGRSSVHLNHSWPPLSVSTISADVETSSVQRSHDISSKLWPGAMSGQESI